MLKLLITITLVLTALFILIPNFTKHTITLISQYTTIAISWTYTKAKTIYRHIKVWDNKFKA